MFALLLIAALCFVSGQAYQVKVKVDDKFKLYASSQLVLSGDDKNRWYTVDIPWAPVLGLYAENLGGDKGFNFQIDGVDSHSSQWRCKTVSSENQIPNWYRDQLDDSQWGRQATVANGQWAAEGGNKCVCRLTVVELDIQVDDIHVLYADGQLVSTGNWYGDVHEKVIAQPLSIAFYAESISDPKGFIIKYNSGQLSGWKCKKVSGQFALTGWYTNWYDASSWGSEEISIAQGNWMWAAEGGNKIYCRKNFCCE